MRPRMRLPLLIAALFVASVAAGCIGSPGKTLTAREGLGDARSAAEAWADGGDLQLLGIFALEPFKRIHHTEGDGEYEFEYVTHLDGNPGDGRAPGWAYAFYTGERCISILLAAGLGVLVEGYETCDDQDVLPDWSVDSSEVAAILGRLDDWPDLGEDGTYFWELFEDDGRAVWAVGGYSPNGESAEALVDASTGEVLEVAHEAGGSGPFFEESSPSARSGTAEASDTAPYLIQGDQLVAEVVLEGPGSIDVQVRANAVVESLVLTLEGPDGVLAEENLGGLVIGVLQQGHGFEDLPPGAYTVRLTSGGSAVLAELLVVASW